MPKGIQKRTIAAFNILATLLACMVTKKLSISPGKAMFNWLYAIGAQLPKMVSGQPRKQKPFRRLDRILSTRSSRSRLSAEVSGN